jgi:DNA-binding response OmpR family regulator
MALQMTTYHGGQSGSEPMPEDCPPNVATINVFASGGQPEAGAVSKQVHNVLVVEDEPSVRKLIQSYLEHEGMKVEVRGDGRSALDYLQSATPDLICLDLVLPEVSGYDICEFVRKTPRLKEVPIMMVSARTLPADRAYAEELGASLYITKPFSRADFLKHVRQLLPAAG